MTSFYAKCKYYSKLVYLKEIIKLASNKTSISPFPEAVKLIFISKDQIKS